MIRGCGRGAALVSDLGAGAARGAGGVGNWSARGAGGMTSCGVGPDGTGAEGIGAGGMGGDCAFAAVVMAALAAAVRMALRIKRALLIQLSPLAPSDWLLPQQPAQRLEDCRISSRRAR